MQKEDLVNKIEGLEKWISKLKIELVHEGRLDGWPLEKYRNDIITYTNELVGLQEILNDLIENENEDFLNL